MTLEIKISNESKPGGPGTVYHNIAECDGITVRKSKGGVIHMLARKLQEAGHHPATPVIVTRDGLTVFGERPLWRWADSALFEPDTGPFRFVKWDYEAAKKLAASRENA